MMLSIIGLYLLVFLLLFVNFNLRKTLRKLYAVIEKFNVNVEAVKSNKIVSKNGSVPIIHTKENHAISM